MSERKEVRDRMHDRKVKQAMDDRAKVKLLRDQERRRREANARLDRHLTSLVMQLGVRVRDRQRGWTGTVIETGLVGKKGAPQVRVDWDGQPEGRRSVMHLERE